MGLVRHRNCRVSKALTHKLNSLHPQVNSQLHHISETNINLNRKLEQRALLYRSNPAWRVGTK